MEKKEEKKDRMEELQQEVEYIYKAFTETIDALKKIERLEEELNELGISYIETWFDYKRNEAVARILPDYFSVSKIEDMEKELGLKNIDLLAIRNYNCELEPFILPRKVTEFISHVREKLGKKVCIRNETTPEKAKYYIDIILKRYEIIYVILRLVYEEEDKEGNQ